MKNNGNFLLGLILIVVGGFWIAGTAGLIKLSLLYMMFKFWPVLLIVTGINILFKGNRGVLLLTVLILVAGILYALQNPEKIPGMKHWQYNGHYSFEEAITRLDDQYDLSEAQSAHLKLDLGIGDIHVTHTAGDQFLYSVPDYNLSRSAITSDTDAKISFKHNKGFGPLVYAEEDDSTFDFELPDELIWDIEIEVGASDTILDLKDLIVKTIDIDAGASSTKLVLGDKSDHTYVDLDTGVSDFELSIKEGVGVRIHADQVISDNNFLPAGLKKNGDYYKTPNYDEADSQVEVEIDSAISDIKIKFY